MELSIATGKSRKTKIWSNKKVTWDFLCDRLCSTVRTPETYREYSAYGKEKQSEIKDRGGFVGGYLEDGARHPKNVKFRQILTLDLDFADLNIWDDFRTLYGCTAVMHSTHKHSKKTPRFRLVLPLDRKVSADEYEAIARKFADTLGINLFDPTTFQPERLMYWPTSSIDGLWVYKRQKGKPLAASEILKTYENWRDISSWPKPDSETDLVAKSLKQQGDPTEKPGLIGAFNRTYNIHQAIAEFLPDVYETTDTDTRYTYTAGEGACGGIVYDDCFFYSHHGSDPIHGQTVNSFDLIRLHKFGHEDDRDGKEVEITKRKSYKLMNEFAKSIHAVVKDLGVHRFSAQEDFADEFYDNDWLGKLTLDKYHKYDNTIPNFELIISNDPHLRGKLLFDRFNIRPICNLPLPWDNGDLVQGAVNGSGLVTSRDWTDEDDAGLRYYLEKEYGLYNATKSKDALDIIFKRNSFHPITDYLDKLEWDGEARLDTIMIDYLGAEDTVYTRLTTRKAFVGAVTRVYRPGCKFDYTLTLIGPEGIKKSTILQKMAGDWFSDSFVGVEGNRSFEQLQGSWLLEMGELSNIKKSEAEGVKHFLVKRFDKYRLPWGKRVSNIPRQGVFFGTTNEYSFLRENNGNRRFWPVEVTGFGKFDVEDLTPEVAAQIWAEAKLLYQKGEKLYLDPDIEEMATDIQRKHTEIDERVGMIAAYLAIPLPGNWERLQLHERLGYLNDPAEIEERGEFKRRTVCVAEIYCELFKAPIKDMGTHNTKYIHSILNNLPGWEKHDCNLTFPIYGKQRAYMNTSLAKLKKRAKA